MKILLLVIILLFQLLDTIFGVKEINELKNKKISTKRRIKFYRDTIIFGWIPVFIVTVFVILDCLSFTDIGLRTINFSNYSWLNIITLIITSTLSLLLLYQIVMFLFSDKYRHAVAELVAKNEKSNNHYDQVINNIMTPRTKKEKVWFSFVSLTAGICEEITWRGTLVFLLQAIFPTLNIISVILISSALFGLLHSYQGIKGIFKTGFIGIIFNLLYYVSDSLIIGIIVHFLFDFSSAFIIREE